MKRGISIVLVLGCIFCLSVVSFAEIDNVCLEKVRQVGVEASRYMQQGKLQDAIEYFNNGLVLGEQCFSLSKASDRDRKIIISLYVNFYLGLSASHASLKDYGKAISVCEEGAKVIPEFMWAFNDSIAALYATQGKDQEAIDICKKTLEAFPNSDTTYHVLGRIYYKIGDYQNAVKYLEKSLEISRSKGNTKLSQETEAILKLIPN